MFHYISGTISEITDNLVVIECNGIGYSCITSSETKSHLTIGGKAKLYTYLAVSENDIQLFAFFDFAELNTFKLLTSVSGVGKRIAVSILSAVSYSSLLYDIYDENSDNIVQAPGVGKKVAQRIIMELKEKVQKEMSAGNITVDADFVGSKTARKQVVNGKIDEAVSALLVLGYQKKDALEMVRDIDVRKSLNEIIRDALKKGAKNI